MTLRTILASSRSISDQRRNNALPVPARVAPVQRKRKKKLTDRSKLPRPLPNKRRRSSSLSLFVAAEGDVFFSDDLNIDVSTFTKPRAESKPKVHNPSVVAAAEGARSSQEPAVPTERFAPKDLVRVAPRSGPGCNNEGGVARVVLAHECGRFVDVRYVLGKRTERNVDVAYVRRETLGTIGSARVLSGGASMCSPGATSKSGEALNEVLETRQELERVMVAEDEVATSATAVPLPSSSPANTNQAPSVPNAADASAIQVTSRVNWVRRTSRCAGLRQMERSDVRRLLHQLRTNQAGMDVLRLKDFLLADTNAQVMREVLEALRRNRVVQALYIQNFEAAMDDDRLAHLSSVLAENKNIWAMNVGENFRVTKRGWEHFCRALAKTHITHMYAGSESTVHGVLKQRMMDAIRANRTKHKRHCSMSNIEVIREIGQMWWNPKNSRHLSGDRLGGDASCGRRSLGLRVRLWDGPADSPTEDEGSDEYSWRLGWITRYDAQRKLHLVAFDDEQAPGPLTDDEQLQCRRDAGGGAADHARAAALLRGRGAWVDFKRTPHMTAVGVVWAKMAGYRWWPAQVFRHCSLMVSECERRAGSGASEGSDFVLFFGSPRECTWLRRSNQKILPFNDESFKRFSVGAGGGRRGGLGGYDEFEFTESIRLANCENARFREVEACKAAAVAVSASPAPSEVTPSGSAPCPAARCVNHSAGTACAKGKPPAASSPRISEGVPPPPPPPPPQPAKVDPSSVGGEHRPRHPFAIGAGEGDATEANAGATPASHCVLSQEASGVVGGWPSGASDAP